MHQADIPVTLATVPGHAHLFSTLKSLMPLYIGHRSTPPSCLFHTYCGNPPLFNWIYPFTWSLEHSHVYPKLKCISKPKTKIGSWGWSSVGKSIWHSSRDRYKFMPITSVLWMVVTGRQDCWSLLATGLVYSSVRPCPEEIRQSKRTQAISSGLYAFLGVYSPIHKEKPQVS